MFGFRKKCNIDHCRNRHRMGGERGERKFRHCISLSDASENRKYIIRTNPDKQTMEMGIAPSSMIFVHKNNSNETNLIIGIGETRLIIPRESAEFIKVR